jgi:cytochrome c553
LHGSKRLSGATGNRKANNTMPRSLSSFTFCAGVLFAVCAGAPAQTPVAPAGVATAITTPLAPPAVISPGARANDTPPASASICFSCHGPDGNPITKEYPILKGQQRDYLAAALAAYRASQRTTTPNALVMSAMAKNLTDADIAELADWFAMVRR